MLLSNPEHFSWKNEANCLNFLTDQWSSQVVARIWTYDDSKIVNFENKVDESQNCIASNANYLFKYTKICQSLQ